MTGRRHRIHALSRRLIAVATVASFLLVGFTAAAEDPPSERKKSAQKIADAAFDKMQQKQYAEAAAMFRKADDRFHSPVFVLFEADAYDKQGLLRNAQQLLQTVIAEELASDASAAFRKAKKKAQAKLSQLEQRIPTVTVIVESDSDVTMTIGDDVYPVDAEAIQLDPGTYAVQVTSLESGATANSSVTLDEGENKTITLTLGPGSADEDGASTSNWWIPSAVAFGVGGAGVLLGAVTGGLFLGQADDLKGKCANFPMPGSDPNVCPPETVGESDDVKLLGNLATAGFVIGGLGISVGAVLFVVLDDDEDPESARYAPRLRVGPTGVSLHGSF